MGLSLGIVGLPNVGKSTLFNTLTKSQTAEASNYPFCTIDPNVGVVTVPDERLSSLTTMVSPEKTIPAAVEFLDIAGLVKGASKGEGLGNKFLSNIRETNAIVMVVRAFEDDNITHVHGSIDPKRDIEIIQAELVMADIETVEKRVNDLDKKKKSNDKEILKQFDCAKALLTWLNEGKMAIEFTVQDDLKSFVRDLHLLSNKQFLYVVNVSEEQLKDKEALQHIEEEIEKQIIPISAKFEYELSQMSDEDAALFLEEYDLRESGLHKLIRIGYDTLGLMTFFTAGHQEVRAWTCKKGSTAPQAAGVIHTDFEKGFIKAEVAAYEDFVACGGWNGVKEQGKMRMEGKDYVMKDGDVVFFRFNN